MPQPIARWIVRLKVATRLQSVVSWYLFSLMTESPKHTLSFAAAMSGLHRAQFSRLLSEHLDLAKASLLLLSQQIAMTISECREVLVPGTSWRVLLIIDSTLHRRSSLHVQNSQRFNHGEGFVVGHQWTNIVLVINDRVIALPPISFLSKNECRRRGVIYKTEHQHIVEYLKDLRLGFWIGAHSTKEVVVLMDSGYDNKNILKMIHGRGWDCVCALKTNRNTKTLASFENKERKWHQVRELFRIVRKQAPWITVRDIAGGGKMRKEFRARRLEGYLKGLTFLVALVCSEKSKGNGRKYLVCSNRDVSVRAIVLAYRKRWLIELFHRAAKNNFGLQDAGVEGFNSLVSHVHWVYCAYLLIHEIEPGKQPGLEQRQRSLNTWLDGEPLRRVIQLSTRYGDKDVITKHCQEVLTEMSA